MLHGTNSDEKCCPRYHVNGHGANFMVVLTIKAREQIPYVVFSR